MSLCKHSSSQERDKLNLFKENEGGLIMLVVITILLQIISGNNNY